jgi:protein-tyrosine phosphatase
MIDFFYYSFLDGMLIGSEDPSIFGNGRDAAKDLCCRYSIKHMITLTPEFNAFEIKGLTRYHVPMYDIPSRQDIERLIIIMERALSYNEAVWVHCKQGIDRTGCVIGAYLAYKGLDPEEVIGELLNKFKKRLSHPKLETLWKDKIDFIRSYAKRAKIGDVSIFDK